MVLGRYFDKSSGKFARNFGRWRLIYHHIVDLPAREHVERENAAVVLDTGSAAVVNPNFVVPLSQSANDDISVAEDRDTGHPAYDFGGVCVAGACNLACRYAAGYTESRFDALQHRCLCVLSPLRRDGDLLKS